MIKSRRPHQLKSVLVLALLPVVQVFAWATVVSVSSAALAAESSLNKDSLPRLLSYDELMSLSPAKREAYVKGLRSLVIELASLQGSNVKGLFAENDRWLDSYSHSLSAWLELLAPVAANAAADPKTSRLIPATQPATFSARQASEQSRVGHVISEPSDLLPDEKAEVKRVILIEQAVGEESFVQAFQQKAAEAATVEERESFQKSADDHQARALEFRQQAANQAELRNTLSGDKNYPKRLRDRDAKRTPEQKKAAEEFDRVLYPGNQSSDAPTPEADPVKPAEDSVSEVKPPEQVVAQPENACPAIQLQCTDISSLSTAKKKALRARLNSDSTKKMKTCNYGGNWSSYAGGRSASGKCQPVFSFCFSPGNCSVGDGPALKCGNSGKAICNPMIFGVQKNGAPFCEPPKGNMSEACNSASTDDTRMPDFLKQQIPGIAEKWNQEIKMFQSICGGDAGDKAAADILTVNCSACKVMASRISSLNKSVTGSCDLPARAEPSYSSAPPKKIPIPIKRPTVK